MQQPGTSNAAPPRFWVFGENMAFPGQPVLDQAVMTLQELSVGNVQYLNAISSALLKWATVFQRVASDVSSRVAFFLKNALNFISFLMFSQKLRIDQEQHALRMKNLHGLSKHVRSIFVS